MAKIKTEASAPAAKPASVATETPAPAAAVVETPAAAAATETPAGETPAAAAKAGDPPETPAGELKPGETKPEVKGAASAEDGKPKAPDKYELVVPDEAARYVSPAQRARFEEIARANDWTLEEAQQELDSHIAAATADHATQVEAWTKRTREHPEFGGDNLAATQQYTRRAIDGLFPEGDELREEFLGILDSEGYGNHLVLVAALARMGKLMSDDKPSLGRPAGKPQTERLATKDAMWPDKPQT